MKAVLTTKVGYGYDDVREQRYHFPATYLNQIKAAEGDLVVYYEPRRTPTSARASDGRQAYFALARIARIESDPQTRDHFYAEVTDYLDFDRDVPFRVGTEYLEGALQRADGGTNRGAFRRSVRLLPSHEFEAIVNYGFSDVAVPNTPSTDAPTGFAEPEAPSYPAHNGGDFQSSLSRPGFRSTDTMGLRSNLRLHRPQDREWRRKSRDSGCPYSTNRPGGTRFGAQRNCLIQHDALDV